MEQSLVIRLVSSIKCGTCGNYYTEENINIIEHSEGLWFFRVFCSSCHVRCLVAAIIREEEETEVFTDLTKEELDRFKFVDTVSANDMLDMHNSLKDYNGDLYNLLLHG